MHRPRIRSLFLAAAIGLALVPAEAAIQSGHVDNFEDGTAQGWTVAVRPFGALHPAPPTNVATGGPAGVDDNYLRLASVGGFGSGSRLTAINGGNAWQGNYLALGITALRLQAINFGTADLDLRILLWNPGVGPPTDAAFSSAPLALLSGSGWTTLEFPLVASALTAELGSVAGALASVTEIRLFHSSADDYPGEAIVAQLGVDNVTALGNGTPPPMGIPEPVSLLLVSTAMASLLIGRRRWRRES